MNVYSVFQGDYGGCELVSIHETEMGALSTMKKVMLKKQKEYSESSGNSNPTEWTSRARKGCSEEYLLYDSRGYCGFANGIKVWFIVEEALTAYLALMNLLDE